MRTRWLPFLTLITLTLGACGRTEVPERSTSETTEAVRVRLATAARETVPLVTQASGSVEPARRISPGTKILGRIDRVLVREGDRVERGQLLASIESRDLGAAVAQAEAALAMAQAQLENARVQHERMHDLHGRGSVTDKSLEDATTGFHVARAAVTQAEANVTAARVHLGYAEIRSPLTGWVVAKKIEAGDMTTPGAPLFTLEDLSRVKIVVNVPEAEVVSLEPGGAARVEITGRALDAVIDRIVPAGDPASRTFSVQLLLDNQDGALKSGMFARVSFEHGEGQVLRVPASALVHRGQLEGLFVVSGDGKARLRWIKTGRASSKAEDARVEILSGLEVGERYVVEPPAGLVDGTLVDGTDVARERALDEVEEKLQVAS